MYPEARKRSSATWRPGIFDEVMNIVPQKNTLNCS